MRTALANAFARLAHWLHPKAVPQALRGTQWSGTFRILDRDHIHNLGENYVAVRVAR